MQGFLSTASSGTVSYHHHPDHATYIAMALEQIFAAPRPYRKRRQAAIDYLREELIDTKRQAAAGRRRDSTRSPISSAHHRRPTAYPGSP